MSEDEKFIVFHPSENEIGMSIAERYKSLIDAARFYHGYNGFNSNDLCIAMLPYEPSQEESKHLTRPNPYVLLSEITDDKRKFYDLEAEAKNPKMLERAIRGILNEKGPEMAKNLKLARSFDLANLVGQLGNQENEEATRNLIRNAGLIKKVGGKK